MKKFASLALILTIILAFAVPAIAAPTGFIGGTVAAIDKYGYDSFIGREITANNSTTVFDDFTFVADNKTLNAWYINVTDDIQGTLEVAYKVGGSYYTVTFDIDGAGKYWIADSKGSNGANMVKIGKFEEREEIELGWLDIWTIWGNDDNFGLPNDDELTGLLRSIFDSGTFGFNMQLTNGYGNVGQYYDASGNLISMKSIQVPIGEMIDFKIDPINGAFEYGGYAYTWAFDWLDDGGYDLLNDTGDGVYFVAGSTPSGHTDFWEKDLIFHFRMDRVLVIETAELSARVYVRAVHVVDNLFRLELDKIEISLKEIYYNGPENTVAYTFMIPEDENYPAYTYNADYTFFIDVYNNPLPEDATRKYTVKIDISQAIATNCEITDIELLD